MHLRPIFRGKDVGVTCTLCHEDENHLPSGVPSALDWRMPLGSMDWENLSETELCFSLMPAVKIKILLAHTICIQQ